MRIFFWLALVISVFQATDVSSKSISQFTKGLERRAGFLDVYYDADKAKVYLDVASKQGDFILLTSLPYGLGSNDIGLDRGLLGDTRLVYFKQSGQRLLLLEKNTQYLAKSDNLAEVNSVRQAFAESAIAGFDIVASQSGRHLIDVTSFLKMDLMGVSDRIKQTNQGSFSVNRKLSMIDESVLKAFPNNVELQAIVTFSGSNAGRYLRSVSPDAKSFTLRQRASFIKLPDEGYQSRVFHPKSGYWSRGYLDYAVGLTDSMQQRFIPRHRLQKKNPAAAVSEAVEPIIYYVDSGAPEAVRNALLDGARWWNQAFEAAGFENAFQVKVMPPDMDPLDVRYNVIQWVHRATRGWSYGASVVDPRTGEILKGHVSLGSLRVRQDLLIAQGLTAPFGETVDQSKQVAMALARIRQLSAHEVGHTLGISHNFAASFNQRASVMDYPHPWIKLTDNNEITLQQAYAVDIGEWDKQVIKYGYSVFSADQEASQLASIIRESKQLGLQFISDPDARAQGGAHYAAHLWDNGADAADELARMRQVRRVALEGFSEKVIPDGTPYSQIEEVLVPIYNLHRFQVEAAVKLVGGVNYQYAVKGEDKFIQRTIESRIQRKALKELLITLSPEFLAVPPPITAIIPPKAYGYQRNRESFKGKTGLTFDPLSAAEASAGQVLSLLFNAQRMTRVAQQSGKQLSIKELLNQMTDALVKKSYREQVQQQIQMRVAQIYLSNLMQGLMSESAPIEVRAALISELDRLSELLTDRLDDLDTDDAYYGFYKILVLTIENGLSESSMPDSWLRQPPGSPIG